MNPGSEYCNRIIRSIDRLEVLLLGKMIPIIKSIVLDIIYTLLSIYKNILYYIY